MTNIRIRTMGMFHTPKTQDELMHYIERLASSEKIAALTAMGMTWNFLASQINKQNEEEE